MDNIVNCSECSDDYDVVGDIVVYKYYFERQIIAAMFITTAILGVTGNTLVVAAVASYRKLRTTTNVFVVNLAVTDMLTSFFIPWQAVAILSVDGWPIPQAPWICAAAAFVTIITFGGSVNTLALIAINRWFGITRSRAVTGRVYTPRKMALMMAYSWGVPLLCALTPVLTEFGELGYEILYGTCTWDRLNKYSAYYNILITVVYYPIQLLVIIASYVSILNYVRKTSRRMARAGDVQSVSGTVSNSGGAGKQRHTRKKLWRRQVAVTKNLIYIVLAYIVCLTPYFVAIISPADWSYRLTPWAGVIIFCNSCINPFIYATSHPDFKQAFRRMLRCQKSYVAGSSGLYKSRNSSEGTVESTQQ